ncbi:hypothetical protein SLA2020_274820 [Shorea laevis]
METVGSALLRPKWLTVSQVGLSPTRATPLNLVATAASLHLGHRVSHQLRLESLLHCCFKKLSRLGHVPRLKDVWCKKALQFKAFNFRQLSKDTMASTYLACFCFFNEGEPRKDFRNDGAPHSKISSRNSFNGRRWTNLLLAANVLIFIAQTATEGKLLLWGAKINSFIDKGQLWRLATSSFLHANIGHLMVNCFSLNSIGPSAENISGPGRFLAIYFASAIAMVRDLICGVRWLFWRSLGCLSVIFVVSSDVCGIRRCQVVLLVGSVVVVIIVAAENSGWWHLQEH